MIDGGHDLAVNPVGSVILNAILSITLTVVCHAEKPHNPLICWWKEVNPYYWGDIFFTLGCCWKGCIGVLFIELF